MSQEDIIQAGALAVCEVLYVPAGAFVFEEVVSGSLNFGVRRPILVKRRGAMQSYECCVQMLKDCKKGVGHFDEVLQFQKPGST